MTMPHTNQSLWQDTTRLLVIPSGAGELFHLAAICYVPPSPPRHRMKDFPIDLHGVLDLANACAGNGFWSGHP